MRTDIYKDLGYPKSYFDNLGIEVLYCKEEIIFIYKSQVVCRGQIISGIGKIPKETIDAIIRDIKEIDIENKVRDVIYKIRHPIVSYKRWKIGLN